MKSCFSINAFMPDVILEYGNRIFYEIKGNLKTSDHFVQRAEERGIDFGDIGLYSVCEVYFDGIRVKEIAIYRWIKNVTVIAYISVNSKRLKTIYKLNEYAFLHGVRNERFNTTIPESLYGLFNAANVSTEYDETIKLEIMNLSNVMKKEMQNIMLNFDSMPDAEILEKIKNYNSLWKQKKKLKSMRS